jgi:hypothetical protein
MVSYLDQYYILHTEIWSAEIIAVLHYDLSSLNVYNPFWSVLL